MEKSFKERAELLMKARYEADSIVAAIMFHRRYQNLSREELAEKSGVEVSVIAKMEDIGICPDFYILIMILRALGLSLAVTECKNDICDL